MNEMGVLIKPQISSNQDQEIEWRSLKYTDMFGFQRREKCCSGSWRWQEKLDWESMLLEADWKCWFENDDVEKTVKRIPKYDF